MNGKLNINSLNKKTILFIFVVIALCAVVSALIVSKVVEDQMTEKYEVQKEAATESLSHSLAPMLDLYDYKQVELTLTSSLIYENIASIAVFDDKGALIRKVTEQNVASEDLDIEKHSITSNDEIIGSFEIGFSKEYIEEQIRTTTGALIFGLIGFLVLAGLALFTFMSRFVIQPLKSFTNTVEEINPENLSIRMKIQREDELGRLAKSFNRMAEDLEKSHIALQKASNELEQKVEERTEQLHAIYEVRRRSSSTVSLEELLPYVVNLLQETFDYYNVNILLLDHGSGNLVLKAGSGGYKGDIPVGLAIKVTEGIVGWVVRTGEPLVVNDVTMESKYLLVPELADTRSELAVPINIGAETLGVLDIQSAQLDAFDEVDLFTAQSLADQIANAIENARLYQETRDITVLEERNRMAREIHDTLAQGFTGIVLQLEAAEQALSEDIGQAQGHLDRARRLARESLNEARRSVWALRPQALEKLPLIETLRQEIERFTQHSGAKATIHTSGKSRILSAEIENTLLRICQESLVNVHKHANASQVEVNLTFEGKIVSLSIHDNGVGFDPEVPAEAAFGLIGMRERTRILGGTLVVKSERGKGTLIEVTIPTDRRERDGTNKGSDC